METATKTAWRVFVDPFASEERWLPACFELAGESKEFAAASPVLPKTNVKGVVAVFLVSALVSWLGAALAGQSVYVMYYLHHLFGQLAYNDRSYLPWESFYFWFNHAAVALAFLPTFFSYCLGFLSNTLKPSRVLYFLYLAGLAIYFVFVPRDSDDFLLHYHQLWLTFGIIGSCLGFVHGRNMWKNLSRALKPQQVFYAMAAGLSPACLFVPALLAQFQVAAAFCAIAPIMIGVSVALAASARSSKTAVALSLSAVSPIVLCALLHMPIAFWFMSHAGPDPTVSGLPQVTRTIAYLFALPVATIALAALGGMAGAKLYASGCQRRGRAM